MRIQQIRVLFWLIIITAVLLSAACQRGDVDAPKTEDVTKPPIVTPTPYELVECIGETDEQILAEITGAIKKEFDSEGDKLTFDYSENTFTIKGELAGRMKLAQLSDVAFRHICVKKLKFELMIYKCPRLQQQCSDGSCQGSC